MTELQRWLSEHDQREIHKLLVAKAVISHAQVDGEHECPGIRCVRVQRLVGLLEQWTMVLLSLLEPVNREKIEPLLKMLDEVVPDMFPDQQAKVRKAIKKCRRELEM